MGYSLNMEVSQTGNGNLGVISRIMTRLTIAKLFQYAGKDVSDFNFVGIEMPNSIYAEDFMYLKKECPTY